MSHIDDLTQEMLRDEIAAGRLHYRFGELRGEIRVCPCGEITSEWERHLCPIDAPATRGGDPPRRQTGNGSPGSTATCQPRRGR